MSKILIDEATVKLALEALEFDSHYGTNKQEAITALREALAEPTSADYAMGYAEGFNDACKPAPATELRELEPVAWRWVNPKGWLTYGETQHDTFVSTPLYTSPPAQRKPLTDEEVEEVWEQVESEDFIDCVHPFARAIEAAHNIKENT